MKMNHIYYNAQPLLNKQPLLRKNKCYFSEADERSETSHDQIKRAYLFQQQPKVGLLLHLHFILSAYIHYILYLKRC